jgi:hypothetical protein
VKTALTVALLMFGTVPLLADRQYVVFDDKVDFSSLRTFAFQGGRATTTRSELNNALILKSVEDAIRAQLVDKGMKEATTSPDVWVHFSVGQDRPNGPSVTFDEGVIVVQMTKRDSSSLIWHGTYRDEKSSPARLAERLPACIKKLLSGYPPKKK